MDLSIIIVNWNSIEFTKDCIASIRSTTTDLEYEIIVVDNNSSDDSCRLLADLTAPVNVIASQYNLGFARANNVGAKRSIGAKILFLNPDTVVLGDAIQRMVATLDSAHEIGAAGCRLLNRDWTLQTSCVQAFPNILNQVFGVEWLRRRWPRLPLLGTQALFPEDTQDAYEVEAVSGACLMIKRDVLENVEGFSSEYFMYAEEIDLCYKIRRAGWKVYHVRDATIVHFGGQSTKKQGAAFTDVILHESIYRFLAKSRGSWYALLYRAAMLLSASVRLTVVLLVLVMPKAMLSRTAALCTFKKWCNIARWSVALPHRAVARDRSLE